MILDIMCRGGMYFVSGFDKNSIHNNYLDLEKESSTENIGPLKNAIK